MNIIETMKSTLEAFPKIQSLHLDYSENAPDEYGLYPTGDKKLSEDVLGNQTRQHTFILYAAFQSFNDYDRLANSGLLLELQLWLEQYADGQAVSTTVNGTQRAGQLTKITCANGMLFNIPDNNMNTAVQYQLQITAEYTIESEE